MKPFAHLGQVVVPLTHTGSVRSLAGCFARPFAGPSARLLRCFRIRLHLLPRSQFSRDDHKTRTSTLVQLSVSAQNKLSDSELAARETKLCFRVRSELQLVRRTDGRTDLRTLSFRRRVLLRVLELTFVNYVDCDRSQLWMRKALRSASSAGVRFTYVRASSAIAINECKYPS